MLWLACGSAGWGRDRHQKGYPFMVYKELKNLMCTLAQGLRLLPLYCMFRLLCEKNVGKKIARKYIMFTLKVLSLTFSVLVKFKSLLYYTCFKDAGSNEPKFI